MSISKSFSLAALSAAFMLGQSYQGGIRGTVADSAGAIVNLAKVSIVDESTAVRRATLSNDSGNYVFTAVEPATYTVVVEAPGFKRFERKNVIVGTQQYLTVDAALELGSVSETVNVTEEVPLIETANASTGQVIDRQQIVDLPNLGRNPFMMAKLAANVVQAGDPRFNRMQDQSGSSQISIAGGPVRGNNYLLDGVPITSSTNVAVIIPTLEAVQEVKIQANTYDAEMGRTGGGVFNTYLKSGSSDFHGAAFGYTRQSEWLANSFFNNAAGITRPNTPQVNFGGAFGGPVIVPKLYNGKHRTFFWLGAERYRQRSGLTQLLAVPTAAERVGDFSKSLTRAGALNVIYDPLSGTTRTPFAGNIIPASRLNPVGLALASYYPNPLSAPAYHGGTDFTGAAVLLDQASQGTAKLDHELFSWWRANLSYLHYKSREPSGNLFGSVSSPGATLLYRKVDATQVNNIFSPNATTVVSVRYGFNRYPNLTGTESDGFNPATLGLPSSFVSQLPVLKFPQVTMQNFSGMGGGSGSYSVFDSRNLLTSVAKYMGRHSVKAGFDFRVLHVDFITYGTAGTFGFNDGFTRRDPNRGNDGTGSDLASLLLGYPASGSANQPTKLFQFVRYYAGYVQDDFRITPKLTLNIGLRYEYETGLRARDNALIVGFDRNVANPIGAPAKGGVMYAGLNGNPTECCNLSNKKFGPRVGFAWSLNSKTTVRGGYGIFWAPPAYSGLATLGYSQTTNLTGSNDGGQTPAATLSNPFPDGLLKPVGNSQGLLTGIGQTITFIDQNSGSTMVQQFSMDIQRELPGNVMMAVGYVSSRTRDLVLGTGAINIDQLESRYLGLGSALLQTVPNPFYGNPAASGVVASPTITQSQLLRPFPQFGAVNQTLSNANNAKYDSLVVRAQKRLSMGLSFLGSWTWSKNMDGSFGATNYYTSSSTSPQNAYDLGAEYGLAIVNTPNSIKGAVTYELPFGKGKRFFAANKVINAFAGEWQVNMVTLLQSGFPLAITQGQNFNSVIGAGVHRPNATGIAPDTSGSVESRLTSYINPAAFSVAPQFTFGNVSRTIGFRGPGTRNFDLSVMKSFTVMERFKGQFRAEALNAFNHPLFNGPASAFGNANFGTITQQGNFPRYIQLGVRVMF